MTLDNANPIEFEGRPPAWSEARLPTKTASPAENNAAGLEPEWCGFWNGYGYDHGVKDE